MLIPDYLDTLRLGKNIKFFDSKSKEYVQIQVNKNETRVYYNMYKSTDGLSEWKLAKKHMYLIEVEKYLNKIFNKYTTFTKIKRLTTYKQ